MIATEIPVDLWLPQPVIPRSQGIHMSGLIRAIATETGILKPEWVEELSLVDVRHISDPVAVLRISIGLAWEEWYIPNMLEPQGVVDHPGELQIDGVYGTPDGESVSVIITSDVGVQLVCHEVKATYKSVNTVADLSSQWMWIAQIKAYLKAMGTRWARLHVLFLCGDYSYPIRPIKKCWELEFTQEEIDSGWQLLRDYRDEWLAREQRDRPPLASRRRLHEMGLLGRGSGGGKSNSRTGDF